MIALATQNCKQNVRWFDGVLRRSLYNHVFGQEQPMYEVMVLMTLDQRRLSHCQSKTRCFIGESDEML
jgi:hypothetical protein